MKKLNIFKQKTLEAIKLTDELIEFMKEFKIDSNYPSIEKLGVNPYYDQISETSTIVVEQYYGYPSKVYSPLGSIKITGSYTAFQSIDKEEFYKQLEERFNLKMFKEPITNNIGVIGGWLSIGGVAPVYSNNLEYNEAKELFEDWLVEYILSK
jgi:hypothetical protein